MRRLTEVSSNTVCKIKWMLGLPDETDQELRDCQIRQGSEICVIQNTGRGMIIRSGARRIAMDAEIAGRICV
ncbi:MAG: ferrous iron transport protein A [Clostridiales bacterium]|nr:ferrous iron transport protein A [Clostridiales bacterium]